MNTLLTMLLILNELSRMSGSLVPLLVSASFFTALLVMLVYVVKGKPHE